MQEALETLIEERIVKTGKKGGNAGSVVTTTVSVETTTTDGVGTETVTIIKSVSDFNQEHIAWVNRRFDIPNPGDLRGVSAFTEEFRKNFGLAPISAVMNDFIRSIHRGVKNKKGQKHYSAPILVGVKIVPYPRVFGKSSGPVSASYSSGRRRRKG